MCLLPVLDGKVDAALEGDRHCRAGLGLYRHRPFLVRAAEDRVTFALRPREQLLGFADLLRRADLNHPAGILRPARVRRRLFLDMRAQHRRVDGFGPGDLDAGVRFRFCRGRSRDPAG